MMALVAFQTPPATKKQNRAALPTLAAAKVEKATRLRDPFGDRAHERRQAPMPQHA